MKKVTLYLDDDLWEAWRIAWLKRHTSASQAAAQVFREKLAALAQESTLTKGETT